MSEIIPLPVIPSELKESRPETDRISGKIGRAFSIPVKVTRLVGAFAISVMMLLMTVDVLGRYFFKHPILGSDEIVGLLNVCLAAACFGYTQRLKGHIRVDLLTERLSPRVRLILDIFTNLISVGVVFLIVWQVIAGAQEFILGTRAGSHSSLVLGIPWYPFVLIFGIGFGVFGLAILADLVTGIIKLGNK